MLGHWPRAADDGVHVKDVFVVVVVGSAVVVGTQLSTVIVFVTVATRLQVDVTDWVLEVAWPEHGVQVANSPVPLVGWQIGNGTWASSQINAQHELYAVGHAEALKGVQVEALA